jgi:phospholipase/carboxylesterase
MRPASAGPSPGERVRFKSAALLSLVLASCFEEAKNEPNPVPVGLGPKEVVKPPEGYVGPIDPEWPPRAETELGVALQASRLLREQLRFAKPGEPLEVERTDLHVEANQIGPFRYLEVIVGKVVHPDDPLPLVVILHGRGNRPQIPEGPISSPIPFRMFLPQAPDPLGEGFTWIAVPTNSEDTQLFARSLSGSLDQLAPAILAFRELRPTLGKPIVVGFSQGGIMTFGLVTRFPRDFAAGFPIAGWLPPTLYPKVHRGQNFPYIFAQHGGADPIVPTENDRETVTALRAKGLWVDYRETPGVGHVVTPEMSDEVRRSVGKILRVFERSVRKRGPTKARG